MKRLALGTLLALAAALPAAALVPEPAEVELLVEMPLAVTTVADFGVPAPEVERVVWQLNEAEVPVVDTVEIVRYTPFPLVVTEYRPVDRLALEPVVDWGGVDWDLDELDMLLLLQTHLDDGLRGELLADAVLADLVALGFDVGAGDRWRPAPSPVERDFVYYLAPGYRFDTDRGLFADRVVVVEPDDFDGRYATLWDGDAWDGDRRDADRRPGDRDRVVLRDRDRDAAGPPAVPPGHAKHGPGGPQPTPGHVKHAGPDGPPGHARDADRPRARGNDHEPGPGHRGNPAKARGKDKDRGGPPARAGNPGRGGGNDKARGNPGKGNAGKGNQGKGKGKGGGKGR